jgi:anti-sigma regulatory factor (Ser/Thr protein kinase)
MTTRCRTLWNKTLWNKMWGERRLVICDHSSSTEGRILILAPYGRDAALAGEALTAASLDPVICADIETLCREMVSDAAMALIANEALTPSTLKRLSEALHGQPPWSDLPLIILTSGGTATVEKKRQTEALAPLGIATLLERPLRVSTLVHAVQAALGARRRQYEVRDHLAEHARLERQIQAEHAKQRIFLRDVLASVTGGRLRLCDARGDLPNPCAETGGPVALSLTGGLSELRQVTRHAAMAESFPDDRWQDLLTGVGEAAMNAAVHAGGGQGYVSWGDGTVQVRVEDQGRGIDMEDLPRAALSKGYTTAGSLGHGMKMMLESTDRLWLLTGAAGTTVVMEQDRQPPKPAWY